MRCIRRQSLKQIKRNVKTKNRECSWKYSLQDNGVDKSICKNFLVNLFQITDSRMKTVLRFCKAGICL